MEILNGVHQLKVRSPKGMPVDTNVYVIEGDDGSIMIDSGWDSQDSLWSLTEALKADRLRLRDIKMIIITHMHPDHYGLASKVKQLCGGKVVMHRIEAELIDARYKHFDDLLKKTEDRLKGNGVPETELPDLKDASLWMRQFVTPDLPDVVLDSDRVSNGSIGLKVVVTPGHSPGHICLYEPTKKLLFSGDHVLYDVTPHVGFNPQSGDNPLGDYISSLEKLEALKVNFVLPGHGPMFNSLHLRIEEILRHHEQRKKDIIKAIAGNLKTAYQIAQEITWMPQQGGIAFNNLAPWDKRLAIMETIAHLNLLSCEGEVATVDMGGVSLYLAKG